MKVPSYRKCRIDLVIVTQAAVLLPIIFGATVQAACIETPPASIFCDDFETGNLDEWTDVTVVTTGDSPTGLESSLKSALLPYGSGSNGAGWMWKKNLREDTVQEDIQYVRWWQYWEDGFQWAPGPGDQKLFMLQALEPQDAWGQTANWKIYVHLVGDERAGAGVAVNELYLDTFIWGGGSQWNGEWNGLQQNRTRTLFRTGIWECTEIEVGHNSPGVANGSIRIWINEVLVMEHNNLKLRNDPISWNAIQLTGYYGDPGVPQNQNSFVDGVVVSAEPIGCNNMVAPNPPANLQAE